ncbi:hypothetical protein GGR26_002728 [Lewinella marina]|uniref:Uncharacterized protein n=1 Tax=Neolewinella marina TaxID=438751 RepID=A0A2G0CD01_9BACT|nr:hypothetical protein [Neolewinella marina]NJB86951.1 hypothetical protein [Neolewinella marina]PHK97853.1 hypothetical protein CGL56_13650 [Neolewinella marina]
MPRHYSQLYRELRAVDPTDYHRIIRMYEAREQEIGRLDVEENFELTVHYVDALFETGAYRQHQLMVDLVIHASIRHDIRYVPGREEEVYEYQLFRKAASAFRIQEYATAEHVLRELIRMQPQREVYVRFLRATLFRQQVPILQFGRASCILCMLLTALIVTINLLIVNNFYPEYAEVATRLSFYVFAGGMLSLFGAYAYAYYLTYREATKFRSAQINKRLH